ncbi:hypothetical protein [Micromonospora sp. NPDC005174]|uniref:phage tail protein n=1 Tax=Micromonospora sp. NPDC005174 TaxID=3157018 RepID=UPI0033AA80DA
MTSPVVVGHAAVEVTASARGFAKKLREAVVAEFKSAGFDKALADAIGKRTIKVPVEPDFDKKSLPKTLPTPAPRTGTPKERVTDPDAVLRAFQADVQRQIRDLSRQAIRIPVSADSDSLRADLAGRIAAVERAVKVEVPTTAGGRGDYERSLRAQIADVTARVGRSVPPVAVKVKADPLTREFQADIQRQVSALSRQANTRIPVRADTAGVRQDIAVELAAIQRTLKAEIPTEPGSRLAYEAKLRAMVAEVSRTIRVSIPVDVDHNRFQRAVAGLASSLPPGVAGAFQRLGDAANTAGTTVTQAIGAAATALTSMVNPAVLAAAAIGVTAAGLLLIGPAASAAAGAIGVLAGAIASIPAFAVGGGAVIGALALGLRGLGDAFKSTGKAAGGGGQSAAAGARQIAAAQRGIAQAQRGLIASERAYRNALAESLRAQRAIDDARKVAARRIQDLGRAVRGATVNEKEAALRVKEAELALREAFRDRNPLEMERAQIELEQAQLAAEDAIQASKDAAVAKADADRRGIEGSEEVVAALDRQRAANDQLLAAADGLKSAQESLTAANESLAAAQEKTGASAGGAAKEMIKLAPAAERFVQAIKDMKPAFENLRLDVQQRLFNGLDKTVRQVGTAWLPQLKTTLGSYADTFNGFFRNLGSSITKPKFIDDIAASAETGRQALEKIGDAVSGPLVDAFGRLSRAAKPFVDAFGDEFSDLVRDFSQWVKSADESGKLQEFFEKTSGYLHDFFRVGRAVASIFKSLTVILFGAEDNGKDSGVVDTLESLADYLNDPENRRQLAEFVASLKEFGRILIEDVIPPIAKVVFWFGSIPDKVRAAGDAITGAFDSVKRAVSDFVGGAALKFGALPGQIGGAVGAIGPVVSFGFTAALDNARRIVSAGLGVVQQHFAALRGRVQQHFAALRGRVQQALSSVPGVVSGLMNTSVGRAITSLATLPTRGAAAVAGLGSRIASTLGGLRGQMYNVGLNVVYGLWDGIAALSGWLRSKIYNFASSVINSFKIGFDSHSPSRRMANEVGRWLPPGLANGMDQAIGSVEAARDRMIAAAIPDVSDAYALNITPVVDPYGAAGATLNAPAQTANTTRLEFVGDAPGSFMRWVKDNVRISYGGDANQAFGRAPTAQLASGR